jgi:uncharacterized protein (DUF433 family)
MNSRIERDERVCGGSPVIRGTRIPVSVIVEQLEHGETYEDLLRGYPELEREGVEAVLEQFRKG